MSEHKEQLRIEIDELAAQNDGLISPENLVEFAKNTSTAWHQEFDWDDAAEAHRHRLHMARRYIKVFVTTIQKVSGPIQIPTYVSLSTDRHKNGGYRQIIAVLENADASARLLADAHKDMHVFMARYAKIQDLLPEVFTAMRHSMGLN